jgi:hypothetical protein
MSCALHVCCNLVLPIMQCRVSSTFIVSKQVSENKEQQESSRHYKSLTSKHPCLRHARAMSWMASARVAGSLLSLPRLITGSGHDDAGGSCPTWLAMDAGKKQGGMPRPQPRDQQLKNLVCSNASSSKCRCVAVKQVLHARSCIYRPYRLCS